ncbi:hypothetical protein PIB30_068891 [Stylosanthes scabra]|uniref:Uncharacterized protein n=1 Tax=Stylosanthes scabra TaxID=79078 RepID=A0ABU6SNK5_9FABA|nr:hypothetical protein [Stylosanthes scabra]
MLKENILYAPSHGDKYKLEILGVNEMICFLNHRDGNIPDWLWIYDCLFTKLTTPKNVNMIESSRGFLCFRAHGKMKIFDLFEESFHSFKEMYFKISGAPRPNLSSAPRRRN